MKVTEHKPLSAYKYFFNNKKRSFSMVLAIGVSILAAMFFQLIFYAVTESGRMSMAGRLDHLTVVYPGDAGIIEDKIINKIKNSPNIQEKVPMLVSTTDYYHLFGNLNIPIYMINSKNLNYVIEHLDMKIQAGRLPKSESNEIILDERTMKNKGKKLGDYIGREVDSSERLPGKYKIVGTLSGDCLIGLRATGSELSEKDGLLLFARNDRLDYLNNELDGIDSAFAQVQTKKYSDEYFKDNLKMLMAASLIITAIIIFIMSFAAGNSSYAQYFSRRYEFATLQSLGYSRLKILLRAAREILLINVAGFIVGIVLLFIVAFGLKLLIFDPKGYPFVFITGGSLLVALIIPLCTMIFSLIPAWWTLSKVNQMDIIEKYE